MTTAGIDPGSAIGKGTLVCVLTDGKAEFFRCASTGRQLIHRFRVILSGIAHALEATGATCVVERPTGLKGNAQQLHGLYWLIVDRLHRGTPPLYSLAPGTLKKFACGKGNGDKAQVATAVTRQWSCCLPEGRDLDVDEADALGMALVGLCRAGGENPNGKPWTAAQLECAAKAEEL